MWVKLEENLHSGDRPGESSLQQHSSIRLRVKDFELLHSHKEFSHVTFLISSFRFSVNMFIFTQLLGLCLFLKKVSRPNSQAIIVSEALSDTLIRRHCLLCVSVLQSKHTGQDSAELTHYMNFKLVLVNAFSFDDSLLHINCMLS